jgi:hypothetical protein
MVTGISIYSIQNIDIPRASPVGLLLLLKAEYGETSLRCRKVEELGKLVNLQGFNIMKVGGKPTATVTTTTSTSSYAYRYVSN